MKRSEFVAGFKVPHVDSVARAIYLAEQAGVTWDPEEPEGFREWFDAWDLDGGRVPATLEETALIAWNACLAHAKTKPRPEEPQGQWFDGMSFEEIDAHLEAGTFPGAMSPGSWIEVPSGFMTWKARQSRQEAQQRTIEAPVDPEVRRKEIEAQIEAWADFQVHLKPAYPATSAGWVAAGHGLLRNYVRLEGF